MNIVEELQKLAEMRRSGALSDEEFTQAKARLLEEERESVSQVTPEQMEVMNLKLELERVEREWLQELEEHLISDRNGKRYLPDEGLTGAYIGTGVVIVAGLIVSTMGNGNRPPEMVCGFVVIVIVMVWQIVNLHRKAAAYDNAWCQYMRRRDEVQHRLSKAKRKVEGAER